MFSAEPPGEQMPKILVVDDSGYTRKMITTALQGEGFTDIVEASTGPEAVNKYKLEKPALVLLDIVLTADMDGIDVLREIKKINPEAKVIVLSAIGQEKYREDASKLGADSYFTKPYSPKEVIGKIRQLLA